MYNILVVFNDGSKKIFKDVIDWGFSAGCYYIEKTNIVTKVRSLMSGENVKYIGPVEYWEEEESKLIRCKDCAYFVCEISSSDYCAHLRTGIVGGMTVKPDDFCSRAVRTCRVEGDC